PPDRHLDGERLGAGLPAELDHCVPPRLSPERFDLGEWRAVDREDLVAGRDAGAIRRTAIVDIGDENRPVLGPRRSADAVISNVSFGREKPPHVPPEGKAENIDEFIV